MGAWFSDSLNGWITGGGYLIDGGIVGRTRDGGKTWRFQTGVLPGGGTRFTLNRVHFFDMNRGCAVGASGIALLTSDGGETWRKTRHGRSGGDMLTDLQFLDERNGWACGPASIVRTQDGGETWGALVTNTAENGYLSASAIHFTDLVHGWLVGQNGCLMRSDDGGVTWTPIQLPLNKDDRPNFWDITFIGATDGWIVGDQGSIFHTTDGGATWTRQANGVPIDRMRGKFEPARPKEPIPDLDDGPSRLTLSAVRFSDANHGYAVGYYADVGESVILGTEDGGASWRIARSEPGEILRALFMIDPDHAWAAGDRARTATQVVLRIADRAR
jgi:photosystem II stability/assembly factor-like uncharacterized protein